MMFYRSCPRTLIGLQQPMPVEVNPVVRFRVQKPMLPAQVPLASTSIKLFQSSLASLLLPHTQANTMGTSPPLSISPDSLSPPRHTAAVTSQWPAMYFTSIRRTIRFHTSWCLVELKPKDRGTISMGALSGTSISLPKMGGAGKLGVSPAKGGAKLTEMMDVPMEMVGKENVVATWSFEGSRAGGGENCEGRVR